ncbi:NERD domain-containing protein [Schinkia azotoformans]|uniref:NERD domain-containing protein n=1 Tax=Schinkia azotoformans TaxID=1454 RepID=UPI002E1E4E18|nr:NERD domain-containing protein [Schinkia azotoformans]
MSGAVVVKASNAKEKIKNYETQLTHLKRYNPNNTVKLWELENRIKGAKGEDAAAYQLKFLPEYHYIINDIRLVHNDLTAQIDHLVISQKGIFLFETKNLGNDIEVDKFDNWYITLKDKTKKGIENPYNQSFRHAEVLKRLLREIEQTPERVNNIPFFHIVALANISSNFKSNSKRNERIVKVDRIPIEVFEISENLPDIFSIDETRKLADYIHSQDQPVKEPQRANIPNTQQRNEQEFEQSLNNISHDIPDVKFVPTYVPSVNTSTINKTITSKSYIPTFSKNKFEYSQLSLFISPIVKYGSLSLLIALTGLIGVKKFFESIQTTPFLIMGLLFIVITYFIYKNGGKNLIISLVIGAVFTSLFGIVPMKIMEFLYYLYFPAFENVIVDDPNKPTIILNLASYVGTGLYGFLLGVFILGFPKAMKKYNDRRWVIPSYITAAVIFIIPFFNNEALNMWVDKHASPQVEQTAVAEVKDHIIPNMLVKQAYKEDVGQEIIYMNLKDMENHGLQENQMVEVIGSTQPLSFPIKSNTKTNSGTIRIQKSVRDKLGVKDGQVLEIRVTE